MSAESKAYTFTHVATKDRQLSWFGCVDDGMAGANLDHAVMLRRLGDKWGQKKISTAICASVLLDESDRLLNVGVDGQVLIFDLPDVETETVDDSDRGPSHLTTLRAARMIGGAVYAVGMARMVYRRDGKNAWTAIDTDIFVPRDQRDQRNQVTGFLCIDGHNDEEIYAAGYGGEIWAFDGTNWTQEASPTDVALACMAIDGAGRVHIAGLGGLYLIGRHGGWQVISHGLHEDDFWGMCTFRGEVYSATLNGLFRFRDGSLTQLDLGENSNLTTAYLGAGEDVMWSAGYKHLMRPEDGDTWTEVATP